jgi:hypothetical protein
MSVRCYGLASLPGLFERTAGRREVHEPIGGRRAPILLLDERTAVEGSRARIDWVRAQPA